MTHLPTSLIGTPVEPYKMFVLTQYDSPSTMSIPRLPWSFKPSLFDYHIHLVVASAAQAAGSIEQSDTAPSHATLNTRDTP